MATGPNNLVQVGDWIEFPAQNIEGEVIDIALSVVKIAVVLMKMARLTPALRAFVGG